MLTVIKGHIGMMRAGGQISAEITEPLQQIEGAADRAAKLTIQLLTFSRQQVLQPAELNLNELVSNLTKMLRRLLSASIAMEVHCAAQSLLISADEGMVEQVLLNFVVNARDAMPRGGTLRVTIEAVDLDEPAARLMEQARPGSFVRLAVSDTGTGIAPEVLPHIFEPFFTTKEVGKGTGLGLATVYGVMQQHNGWARVESEVGRGSIFSVYFPRVPVPAQSKPPTHARPLGQGGDEGILLVEDEPSVRQVATSVLQGLGYRVFTASSGLAALQVWAAHKAEIELLLTDLVMPDGVNGRELALRLLAAKPRLPVVYMSGYSHEVAGEDFRLEPGVNYLPKPFDLGSLAKIVRDNLDHRVSGMPFVDPR
jgi:CheY-like chemotaxis protein